MASDNFVLNLGAMYDSLEELASLSKDLQERNLMLPRAHTLVQRQLRVFLSMVDYPGIHYKEAKSAVEGGNSEAENKFKGVVVTDSRKSDVQIRYEQFMRSLATNLEKRLISCNQNTEALLSAINVQCNCIVKDLVALECRTLSWLECETSGTGARKTVEHLKCKLCIQYRSSIEGRRKFNDK